MRVGYSEIADEIATNAKALDYEVTTLAKCFAENNCKQVYPTIQVQRLNQ